MIGIRERPNSRQVIGRCLSSSEHGGLVVWSFMLSLRLKEYWPTPKGVSSSEIGVEGSC